MGVKTVVTRRIQRAQRWPFSPFRRTGPLVTTLVTLGLLAAPGCYSGLDAEGGSANADGSAEGAEGGTGAEEGGSGDDGPGVDDAGPADELPAPSTRLFRLTHEQWENTIQDLFYLPEPTGFAVDFRTDPSVGGFVFDNNAATLEVDQALWQSYQRAAVQVGELVTSDPALLAALLPPDGGDPTARAQQFVQEFGARAYRRPLEAAELTELTALFETAPPLYTDLEPFAAGVRLAIETVLQSPHFIYRVEISNDVAGGVIPLGEYELAQRLSYFLWNSMPDDELFDAAADASLADADGLADQARRMLDDVRARSVVEHFHDQVFEVERFQNAAPAPAFYEDVPANLGDLATEEHHRFIEDVVFERGGGIAELLTSNETFVNDEVARIYGIEGDFGPEFTRATVDANERGGLLTQLGFLVANSTTANSDPIHRGVFVAKRLACMKIAAPPDGVPPVPPAEGRSNRQTVEDHTEQPGTSCVGCHITIINPFGFAFEHYDALGAYRLEDNTHPVDASATVPLGDDGVAINGAVELSQALAASPVVHACYLQHWVEFAFGRAVAPADAAFTSRVGEASQAGDMPVRDLLTEIVTSNAFRSRATEELQ